MLKQLTRFWSLNLQTLQVAADFGLAYAQLMLLLVARRRDG